MLRMVTWSYNCLLRIISWLQLYTNKWLLLNEYQQIIIIEYKSLLKAV